MNSDNLEFIRILEMKRGDGKSYEIEVKDQDTREPYNLTGYTAKFVVKEFDKIFDDTALLSSGDADITDEENGIITIQIAPEDSEKFPITKEDKPLVLAVQIRNDDIKFSEEFHFGIIVKPNVFGGK